MRHSTAESLAKARARFAELNERLARQMEAVKEQTQRYATENKARADWGTVGTASSLSKAMEQAIKDIQSALDYRNRMQGKTGSEDNRFCTCGKPADAWCEANEAWECGECHIDATCDHDQN